MLEQPASLFSFYVFPELLVFAGFISVFLLFRLQRANCVAVQKQGCGLQFNMRPLSDGNIYNDYHAISASLRQVVADNGSNIHGQWRIDMNTPK